MAEVNAPELLPTRLRLNFLLYDPYTQRYRHVAMQSRAVVIETPEQWHKLVSAIDVAIARINAER